MTHAAFQNFYTRTSKRLWAYLLRICDNPEIAKDIMQESYLRCLQNPPKSDELAQMQGYLYTIATRLNRDRIKQSQRRNAWNLKLFGGQENTTDEVLQNTGSQVDLELIFKQMKPRERALLWLAYVEEQPHSAIAGILGLREKSVKVVLYRARQKLARILKKLDFEEQVL